MYGNTASDTSIGIYVVAAIERPTVAAAEQGAIAKMVLEPTAVIANGRSSAIAAAMKKLGTTSFDDQRTTWMVQRFKGDTV